MVLLGNWPRSLGRVVGRIQGMQTDQKEEFDEEIHKGQNSMCSAPACLLPLMPKRNQPGLDLAHAAHKCFTRSTGASVSACSLQLLGGGGVGGSRRGLVANLYLPEHKLPHALSILSSAQYLSAALSSPCCNCLRFACGKGMRPCIGNFELWLVTI